MCSSLDQNDGNDNNDYVESQWFNNTRLITTVRMILRRKTVDVWPGHKSVPIIVCCFRLIFVGLGSLEILAETQLRCVSDLSLDLALGVHLLRLLWRERLVPRKCAKPCCGGLENPWQCGKTMENCAQGRCETDWNWLQVLANRCLQGLYYI